MEQTHQMKTDPPPQAPDRHARGVVFGGAEFIATHLSERLADGGADCIHPARITGLMAPTRARQHGFHTRDRIKAALTDWKDQSDGAFL